MRNSVKKGLIAVGVLAASATVASADVIAAPDTTDVMTSLGNVFGAVLLVAVTIYGYNKVKGLLR